MSRRNAPHAVTERCEAILAAAPVGPGDGEVIGHSREGRAICAFRFGGGPIRVSLLAGCHADEPVGPKLLRHFCGYLSSLPKDDALVERYEWWIVPHINPDGECRNQVWYQPDDTEYDLVKYLSGVVRELPGDDIEFGFPRREDDVDVRPENRAAYDWWRGANGQFDLHISLHGTGFAAGPWFLIEEAWSDRCDLLKKLCTARVEELGYTLHDVERLGEKGFFRLGRGFCTRPDSRYMRQYFVDRGDESTAQLFRPSSMEIMRSLGGDPLTLVSEMPLFITPGVGETLGPPDPVAQEFKAAIGRWKVGLLQDMPGDSVAREAAGLGLRAMPVPDQMMLQLTLMGAGILQVELARTNA
ncbi:MAG: M14 family zinc carboxypeptidase [Gemmatimonadales bacterium]